MVPCPYCPAPCTPNPAPCTLHPELRTLHPAPWTLHPEPCTLHPALYPMLLSKPIIHMPELSHGEWLNSDPLTVAFDSYMKVIQLDDKDGFSKSVKIKFTILIEDLTNLAIAAMTEENYEKALRSYEQIMAIQQTPVYKADDPNAVDTVIVFSAGLAAYNAQNYDKAIEYFSKVAKYKFNGAKTYILIASSYTQKKDINGALQVLQEGSKEYPQESSLLVEIINIYIYKNQVNEAIKYLEMAIA